MLPSANKHSQVSQAILLQSSLRADHPSVHATKVPQLLVTEMAQFECPSWDYLATVIFLCVC